MTTSTPELQGTLLGRFVSKRLIHRGACGTWHEAAPAASLNGATLPTEFAPARGGRSHHRTLVAREPTPDEVVGADSVGLIHRHLVEITDAEWMTDSTGRRLFVQATSCEPRGFASQLASDQIVLQWRRIVSAVASALAHLHAFGLAHGAVHLDNIFQHGDTWRLGPSLCSRGVCTADDLEALASLIGTELRRFAADSYDEPLLARLGELCMVGGVGAAHIAVWAEDGVPDTLPAMRAQIPPMPKVERTPDGFRLSGQSDDAMVFLSCEPHRAPKAGSMVPISQFDQLGTSLPVSSLGEAVMPEPRQTTVVFCVAVSSGVATVGHHSLVDPPRGWGDLHVLIRPEGVVLRWFWPKDTPFRKMRIQIRPDRYPRLRGDDSVTECHRAAYETAGQFLVPIPQHWTGAFVQVARADAPADSGQDAVYGKAERNTPPPKAGARARFTSRPVRPITARA